ncbi:unnamed protein product [Strongylus vulgaris]|uniref:Translation initiation factor eIF2B subunit alpha n=1 Tax=Strongylus vulgaris TaxID=40348 RepID=A0A3P7LP63_STRVU|nr:unnamed protein product [Strongylus vulgaris]
MIRTNKKAKRRRTQFEFPDSEPPPPPLKFARSSIKQEIQEPIHEHVHRYQPSSLQPSSSHQTRSKTLMTPAPTPSCLGTAEGFSQLLASDSSKSVGVAAIETLLTALENSRALAATTVNELNKELTEIVNGMAKTDYSSTSIRSASDLFRRFITLAPAELLDQRDFTKVLSFYRQRGKIFIERVGKSRGMIARHARPFFRNNMELTEIVNGMAKTDYSSTSIRSASDLFRRFITLAPAELLDQRDFTKVLSFYRQRGKIFIERVGKSRGMIARHARPFFRNNMNILTHSYSKVVLEALTTVHRTGTVVHVWNILTHSYSKVVLEALTTVHRTGTVVHVWVTESQPDASGRIMCDALRKEGIKATLILDSAVGYLMERIDMVVVGAEGVMETGGIINKVGFIFRK